VSCSASARQAQIDRHPGQFSSELTRPELAPTASRPRQIRRCPRRFLQNMSTAEKQLTGRGNILRKAAGAGWPGRQARYSLSQFPVRPGHRLRVSVRWPDRLLATLRSSAQTPRFVPLTGPLQTLQTRLELLLTLCWAACSSPLAHYQPRHQTGCPAIRLIPRANR